MSKGVWWLASTVSSFQSSVTNHITLTRLAYCLISLDLCGSVQLVEATSLPLYLNHKLIETINVLYRLCINLLDAFIQSDKVVSNLQALDIQSKTLTTKLFSFHCIAWRLYCTCACVLLHMMNLNQILQRHLMCMLM